MAKTLTYTLDRAAFTEKQAELAKFGVESTDNGTITHEGVQAEYSYVEPTLTVTILKHPFIETEGLIDSRLDQWFGVVTNA